MENQASKQDDLRAEKQDTVSSEKEENIKKAENKTVISIKDLIDEHPTSKAVHDIASDEQQHNEKSN